MLRRTWAETMWHDKYNRRCQVGGYRQSCSSSIHRCRQYLPCRLLRLRLCTHRSSKPHRGRSCHRAHGCRRDNRWPHRRSFRVCRMLQQTRGIVCRWVLVNMCHLTSPLNLLPQRPPHTPPDTKRPHPYPQRFSRLTRRAFPTPSTYPQPYAVPSPEALTYPLPYNSPSSEALTMVTIYTPRFVDVPNRTLDLRQCFVRQSADEQTHIG